MPGLLQIDFDAPAGILRDRWLNADPVIRSAIHDGLADVGPVLAQKVQRDAASRLRRRTGRLFASIESWFEDTSEGHDMGLAVGVKHASETADYAYLLGPFDKDIYPKKGIILAIPLRSFWGDEDPGSPRNYPGWWGKSKRGNIIFFSIQSGRLAALFVGKLHVKVRGRHILDETVIGVAPWITQVVSQKILQYLSGFTIGKQDTYIQQGYSSVFLTRGNA